jgi:hypothetical protein
MNGMEAARIAVNDGVQLFRPRKDALGEYDVKPYFTGQKRGWVALDSFSASAIVQVYDALNETNKAKFAALPIHKMARIAFKFVVKSSPTRV